MPDVSPEFLGKLAELIKAAAAAGVACAPQQPAFLNLKGLTDLLGAVAWPGAALICVFLFREPLAAFLSGADSIKTPFGEISRQKKIDKQVEQSAKEAQNKTDMRNPPSAEELGRAEIVKSLAADVDITWITRQAEDLAIEYQRVRDSMPSGNARTRAMGVVVSKMRTIGQAFFPIRYEFASSASPGKRLMVIASLQVSPDYEMLDWLAERVGSEKPFLQYHALVALQLAVKGSNAKAHVPAIQAAVEKASQFRDHFHGDASRIETLDQIKKVVEALKAAAA